MISKICANRQKLVGFISLYGQIKSAFRKNVGQNSKFGTFFCTSFMPFISEFIANQIASDACIYPGIIVTFSTVSFSHSFQGCFRILNFLEAFFSYLSKP